MIAKPKSTFPDFSRGHASSRSRRWWIVELNMLNPPRREPTPGEERHAARKDPRQQWLPGLNPTLHPVVATVAAQMGPMTLTSCAEISGERR